MKDRNNNIPSLKFQKFETVSELMQIEKQRSKSYFKVFLITI